MFFGHCVLHRDLVIVLKKCLKRGHCCFCCYNGRNIYARRKDRYILNKTQTEPHTGTCMSIRCLLISFSKVMCYLDGYIFFAIYGKLAPCVLCKMHLIFLSINGPFH